MEKEFVSITVTADTREEVEALLDACAEDRFETWRRIYRMRKQTSYRGYAGYETDWRGMHIDLRTAPEIADDAR